MHTCWKVSAFQLDESKAGRHPTQFIIFWDLQVILIRINKKNHISVLFVYMSPKISATKANSQDKVYDWLPFQIPHLDKQSIQTTLQSFKLFFGAKTKTQKVKIINKNKQASYKSRGQKNELIPIPNATFWQTLQYNQHPIKFRTSTNFFNSKN